MSVFDVSADGSVVPFSLRALQSTRASTELTKQTPPSSIGTRLRDWRIAAKVPRGEIADLLDTTERRICAYEADEVPIAASDLFLIAQHFGVSIDSFFEPLLPCNDPVAQRSAEVVQNSIKMSDAHFNAFTAVVRAIATAAHPDVTDP